MTISSLMNADDLNNLKNVKEYTLNDYKELGTRLGEAMFYFIKYQDLVEQLEKSNQELITKELALAFDTKTKEAEKEIQWKKELTARRPILSFIRGELVSTASKSPQAETVQEGEIMTDILQEFNNNNEQEHEDSDASFDENILEEQRIKSLTHMNYKENLQVEKSTKPKCRKNKSFSNVSSYEETAFRTSYYRKFSSERRTQFDRRKPIELINCTVNYRKGYTGNSTIYSNNNFPPQKIHRLMVKNPWVNGKKLKNSSILNATINNDLELRPFLMFMKQKRKTRPSTSQGLHMFKNDLNPRREFLWKNGIKKPERKICMFSIESQRIQLLNRTGSKTHTKNLNKLCLRRRLND